MNKISILVIEDNPADLVLVGEFLADISGGAHEVATSATMAEALAFLAGKHVDVALLDLNLPDSTGLETVRTLIGKHPRVAVIVLTGLQDEQFALQSVRYGAQDYLNKSLLSSDMLHRSIAYSLERKKSLREKENLLADLAMALERIEILQEILPVCVCCKKIQAEDSNWYQPEDYFRNRGEAAASHRSFCPECMHDLHAGGLVS